MTWQLSTSDKCLSNIPFMRTPPQIHFCVTIPGMLQNFQKEAVFIFNFHNVRCNPSPYSIVLIISTSRSFRNFSILLSLLLHYVQIYYWLRAQFLFTSTFSDLRKFISFHRSFHIISPTPGVAVAKDTAVAGTCSTTYVPVHHSFTYTLTSNVKHLQLSTPLYEVTMSAPLGPMLFINVTASKQYGK
jgi:hypothetical protein